MSPLFPLPLSAAAALPSDLVVTLTPGPASGPIQQVLASVRVLGPGDAPDVHLRLLLGGSAALVSAHGVAGACSPSGCELGALAPGASAQVVLVVRGGAAPGALEVAAASAVPDPTPDDARASLSLRGSSPVAGRALLPVRATCRLSADGRRVLVRGRVVSSPSTVASLRVRLASPWWPRLASAVRVRPGAQGGFAASLPAVASGRVSLSAGSSRPVVVGAVAVRPRIALRLRGLAGTPGTFAAVRASGTFAPTAAGEGALLAWQARTPAGWRSVGGAEDAVRVHDGRLRGTLRLGALRRSNRYRLVYEPLNRAPLAAGRSATVRAQEGG